jgi:hypothetical protein
MCSHECQPIGGEKKKKKSLLGFLTKTIKLPFMHAGSAKKRRPSVKR